MILPLTVVGDQIWSQAGSFCCYQLTHTKVIFVATEGISSMTSEDIGPDTELTYPRFPLNSGNDFVKSWMILKKHFLVPL